MLFLVPHFPVQNIVKGRKNVDAEGTELLGTSLSFSSEVSRRKILQQVRIFCGFLFICSSLKAYLLIL
jgi:hypothetical protein